MGNALLDAAQQAEVDQRYAKLRKAGSGKHFNEKGSYAWILRNLALPPEHIEPKSAPCLEAVAMLQEIQKDELIRQKFMTDAVLKRMVKVCEVSDSSGEQVEDDGRTLDEVYRDFQIQHRCAVLQAGAEITT